MTSLLRFVVPSSSRSAIILTLLWAAVLGVASLAVFIVVRSCGNAPTPVANYALYLALYVALPGLVVMYGVNRGPISLAQAIALGLPTGFAVEIFTYLGCAAFGLKEAYPWVPLGWLAIAAGARWARGEWPVRWRVTAHHAGICLCLAVVFLATTLMAASQMYSESPLEAGMPTRAIFHDWVYLVSRAGVIKNNWPLDDPSLAGTPLQYHYFMMVHAAAASSTREIELSALMLRLIFVPLGAILVTQSYVLGRAVSRSPWGGVIAAVLIVMASEVSLAPSYGEPRFLGLFIRWLFVSPTFFFGMVFCGALLIAVGQCTGMKRCGLIHYLWLVLLGAAGTGAKGTVLPVVLCALGLWTAWRWWRERRLSGRLVLFGLCLTAAFTVVYVPTMSAWRTGDAAWRPFSVFELSSFWRQHLPTLQQWLGTWLPTGIAKGMAAIVCGVVVFAGTCGIRLLAIPYLFMGGRNARQSVLAGWLGSFLVASVGMGLLMSLNSHGELYVLLMMRLPMAVLTAALLVQWARGMVRWWRASRVPGGEGRPDFVRNVLGSASATPGEMGGVMRWLTGAGVVALLAILGVQSSLWFVRNRTGFQEWLKTPTNLKPDGYMQELREALLWVRDHTEPNAVLVANACTPENMKKDHWGALDRTLTGVHFYYSALSERRLWFEGPNYILDTTRARIRANLASNFFYRRRALRAGTIGSAPSYVLLDRSLKDGAEVTLPLGARVFSNARMDIYRLSAPPAPGSQLAATEGAQD